VNFWQPSGSRAFRALQPGEPFLFKLHAPDDYIVGGGMFAGHVVVPVDFAWEAFGERNGVASLDEMRLRIAKYRHVAPDPGENYALGCIILRLPFFLPRDQWIPSPAELPRHVQQGKTFDATAGAGKALWQAVERSARMAHLEYAVRVIESAMWSEPRLV